MSTSISDPAILPNTDDKHQDFRRTSVQAPGDVVDNVRARMRNPGCPTVVLIPHLNHDKLDRAVSESDSPTSFLFSCIVALPRSCVPSEAQLNRYGKIESKATEMMDRARAQYWSRHLPSGKSRRYSPLDAEDWWLEAANCVDEHLTGELHQPTATSIRVMRFEDMKLYLRRTPSPSVIRHGGGSSNTATALSLSTSLQADGAHEGDEIRGEGDSQARRPSNTASAGLAERVEQSDFEELSLHEKGQFNSDYGDWFNVV